MRRSSAGQRGLRGSLRVSGCPESEMSTLFSAIWAGVSCEANCTQFGSGFVLRTCGRKVYKFALVTHYPNRLGATSHYPNRLCADEPLQSGSSYSPPVSACLRQHRWHGACLRQHRWLPRLNPVGGEQITGTADLYKLLVAPAAKF